MALQFDAFSGAIAHLSKSLVVANKNAIELITEEFIKDANYYAPQDTNMLRLSALTASRPKEGLAIWDVAYAKKLFYGDSFNFNKSANQHAQSRWADKAAKANKEKYIRLHKKVMKEQLKKR